MVIVGLTQKIERGERKLNELPKLFMMVGIPGSGKSYESEVIAKEHDAVIHASDKIREEFSKNPNLKGDNNLVFNQLHFRIQRDLKVGKNVVYDATNINSRRRKAFLNSIKSIPCEKIAIIMATPYEQCIKNNAERDDSIPESVIEKMYKNFQVPYYYEGFDVIQIVLWQETDYKQALDFLKRYKDFDQENKHHRLTLGAHAEMAIDYTLSRYLSGESGYIPELAWASLLHDCGKPFCKEFKEGDENAHYYGHMNVGAYDSFFYTARLNCDSLLIAWLINWHMEPFFWKKDEKLREKRLKLWGKDLFEMIEKIHEADLFAH